MRTFSPSLFVVLSDYGLQATLSLVQVIPRTFPLIRLFYLGVVYIDCLPMFPKEKVKELTVEQLLDEVQKIFDKGWKELPKDLPYTHNEQGYGFFLVFLVWILFWIYLIVRIFI